jgi:hypothetical protein
VSVSSEVTRHGRDFRCSMVLNCWKTQDPATVDFNAPENFLWRIWRSAGSDAKGDLRASQAFVRYLRANWIDSLVQRKDAHDKFFMRERFFKTTEEKNAFASYFV